MDETECTASNFMPKDLIEIICILERGEKCHSYKIIRKRKNFTLVTNFPAKNGESTPLKNDASGQQTASHQDKKEVSFKEKPLNRKPKCKRINLQLFLPDASLLNNILFKIPPM